MEIMISMLTTWSVTMSSMLSLVPNVMVHRRDLSRDHAHGSQPS